MAFNRVNSNRHRVVFVGAPHLKESARSQFLSGIVSMEVKSTGGNWIWSFDPFLGRPEICFYIVDINEIYDHFFFWEAWQLVESNFMWFIQDWGGPLCTLNGKNTTKQALPVRTAHKHHSDKQWRYPPVSGPGTSHVVAVSIQLFHQRSRNPTKKKRRPHRSWKHLLWGKGLEFQVGDKNHMAESEIPRGITLRPSLATAMLGPR